MKLGIVSFSISLGLGNDLESQALTSVSVSQETIRPPLITILVQEGFAAEARERMR